MLLRKRSILIERIEKENCIVLYCIVLNGIQMKNNEVSEGGRHRRVEWGSHKATNGRMHDGLCNFNDITLSLTS